MFDFLSLSIVTGSDGVPNNTFLSLFWKFVFTRVICFQVKKHEFKIHVIPCLKYHHFHTVFYYPILNDIFTTFLIMKLPKNSVQDKRPAINNSTYPSYLQHLKHHPS